MTLPGCLSGYARFARSGRPLDRQRLRAATVFRSRSPGGWFVVREDLLHEEPGGRVDRVDRLPDGGYELIDYKTGKAKTAAELREDVQLSIYQMGARESWQLPTAAQSYLYVLDGEKVPVSHSEEELERVRSTVGEVADGILEQRFEPKPSYEICSFCDYRIACPAAER